MNRASWLKAYEKIKQQLAPLHLNFGKDEEARDVLNDLIARNHSHSLNFLRGKTVVVFAAGKSSNNFLSDKKFLHAHDIVFIATDGVLEKLFAAGMTPHLVCTDLDSDFRFISKASKLGSITVVHAHGDNIPKIKKHVPRLAGIIIGTTQIAPTRKIHNFGGFTDGDRAVFLALRFGAKAIGLTGFDAKTKKHKLGLKLVRQLKQKNKNILDLNKKQEFKQFMKLSV